MKVQMIGTKVGMTQIFDETGKVIPVTVLKVGPCYVIRKKTIEKDGYSAIVLGYGDIKEKKVRKSEEGLFKLANVSPKRILKESKVIPEELDKFEVGQELKVDIFKKGEYVDITGMSKGRGFTGVIKRHGMSGAKDSHGTHEYFRHGGSIGSSAYPSHVFKGIKMAGHYGASKITVQNLKIIDVREDKGIVIVKGAVPGPNKGYIFISHAVKKPASKVGT